MNSEGKQVIAELSEWAELGVSPAEFDEDNVIAQSPDLHERAVSAFGSWASALGATLTNIAAIRSGDSNETSARATADQDLETPPEDRVVGPESAREGVMIAQDGRAARIGLQSFAVTSDGPHPLPEEVSEQICRLVPGESDASLAVLTRDGRLVSLLREQFPDYPLRNVWREIQGEDGGPDGWSDAMLRSALRRNDRVYFVSENGQIKASDAGEYERRLDAQGVSGIIIKEGDAAAAVFVGNKRQNVCIASSGGKAIVFEPDEVRTQGLKAQGVRGIQLASDERVVGAFNTYQVEDFFLISEEGYGKRLDADEFRSQGRGGGGLQTCRLSTGDAVASLQPCSASLDAIVFTSSGRFQRIPLYSVPLMGRPARGERLVEIQGGERVVGASIVPAGTLP